MEIITELQKQKIENSTKTPFRLFEAIEVGNYKIRPQGSEVHYCTPQKTLPANAYSSMELAILNKKWDFLHINKSSIFRAFPRYPELIERVDTLNGENPVFSWVPVDLLNDLYLYLNN